MGFGSIFTGRDDLQQWVPELDAFAVSKLGPRPSVIYGSGEYAGDLYSGDPEAAAEWDRRYRAEVEPAFVASLPPDRQAAYLAAKQGRSDTISTANKISKGLALATVGAAAGGAALTAAGIIGPTAAASSTSLDAAIAASASGDAAIAGTAATAGAATVGTAGAGLTGAGLLSSLGGIGGLINAGLGVTAAVIGAKGAKDQAEEDQATALYNAQEAEAAARNALLRGEEEARTIRRKGSLIEGEQRATFSARGLTLETGSPRQAIDQVRFFTDEDMATARSNAATEAATYRRQGSRYNAQAANINPSRTGGLSLVSNLATVASRWYDRYGDFKP